MTKDPEVSLASLKSTSSKLRAIGSRALRSADDDARANLRRLLAFVDSTPILTSRIAEAGPVSNSALPALKEAAENSTKLEMPIEEDRELAFLHRLLEDVSSWDGEEELWRLTYGYGGKRGVKDGLEQFLHDAVQPYLSILTRELESLILSRNETTSGGVEVHISGGQSQVNIAQGGARIVAKQEVRPEVEEVLRAAEALRSAIAARSSDREAGDEHLDLAELADGVREEVSREAPRKQFLQMLHERLVTVSGSLVAADKIGEKVRVLIDAVRELVEKAS